MGLSRRFPADVFQYVANGKIDRVGCLSMELGELSFVRGYYDGNDGAIFVSGCRLYLFLAEKGEDQRTVMKT